MRPTLGHQRRRRKLVERADLESSCFKATGEIGDELPIGRNRHVGGPSCHIQRLGVVRADHEACESFRSGTHLAPHRDADDGAPD